MPKKPKIAVVIPAYNEARVLGRVLDELPREGRVHGTTYPLTVIVVNDGSHDQTAAVVAKRKDVVLINHVINMGNGAATRTGLAYALRTGHDYAVTMDADGQHLGNDAVKIITEIVKGKSDFILGSRLINTKGMPWHRILGNWGLSFITFLMFGVFVTDSQTGLRAFNQKALQDITYYSNRFAFCSEMIWRAHQKGLRITEIPIKAVYTDYSLSKGQRNWDVVHILRHLAKQRLMEFING